MAKRTKTILLCAGAAVVVLAVAAVLLLGGSASGDKPFAALKASDIAAASVKLMPPDTTIVLNEAQIQTLAGLLNDVVLHEEDDGYTSYCGQAVEFTLALQSGETRTVVAYSPFLILDGVGYQTEHAPCSALNQFANDLLREENVS